MTDACQISLIIECENINDVGTERAGRVFQALRTQIEAVASRRQLRGEVLVMYAAGSAKLEEIRAAIAAMLGESCAWPVRATACVGPPYQYYEQKNLAAKDAAGDVLIYLDSDCIPQEGWLEHMIAAFDDPDVSVCAGTTRFDRDSGYSRSFAYLVHWQIEEPTTARVIRASSFNANNVGFRRSVFLAHPYPDNGSYKARCVQLWRELQDAGIAIHHATRAEVFHPAPVNPRHFIAKAVGLGHDYALQFMARRDTSRTAAFRFAGNKFGICLGEVRMRLDTVEPRASFAFRVQTLALATVYFSIVSATTLLGSVRSRRSIRRFLGLAVDA